MGQCVVVRFSITQQHHNTSCSRTVGSTRAEYSTAQTCQLVLLLYWSFYWQRVSTGVAGVCTALQAVPLGVPLCVLDVQSCPWVVPGFGLCGAFDGIMQIMPIRALLKNHWVLDCMFDIADSSAVEEPSSIRLHA